MSPFFVLMAMDSLLPGLDAQALATGDGVALDVLLLAALDGKGVVGHIVRDAGAGTRNGAGANVDGRHHHGVRANEGAVADGGVALVHAVVVAGDGPAADVHASAHLRVANV